MIYPDFQKDLKKLGEGVMEKERKEKRGKRKMGEERKEEEEEEGVNCYLPDGTTPLIQVFEKNIIFFSFSLISLFYKGERKEILLYIGFCSSS